MKIITGNRFQNLCKLHISSENNKQFELFDESRWTDIADYKLRRVDNPEWVYVNISLLNRQKPAIAKYKLYEKLLMFINPFYLVLHNADQNFEEEFKDLFRIPMCKKIFSENVNFLDSRLQPLPMGFANPFWEYGKEEMLLEAIKTPVEKTEFLHYYFKVNGGARDEWRPQCVNALDKLGLQMLPLVPFENYIKDLSRYKYCISPPGNALDCYRMWECLYLKVIPICIRVPLVEYFAKFFPIVILDSWEDLDLEYLERNYEKLSNWENYDLLDFDNFLTRFFPDDKSYL